MAIYRLSQSDRGRTVLVRKGDEIVVTLPENPTTGFRWKMELTGKVLQPLDSPVFLPAGPGIGSGGGRTFTLVANDVGESVITFKLRRAWGPDMPSDTDVKLQININE